MPTLTQIRDAIKATIETVPGVGLVHTYERFAIREKDFRALYETGVAPDTRILGWHIRRVLTRERSPAVGRSVVANEWTIRGFMGLDDAAASELTFDGLVESIADVFRANPDLGGVVASTTQEDSELAGIQVIDSGPVMFAGVLCHSARLQLFTTHFL